MEAACRHAQNPRRVNSAMERFSSSHSGGICRHFLNGSCRFGPRCIYRHELPALPSAQICRYFQKGGCWYGERCRYLHILRPDGDTAVSGRRGSVPAVSSSTEAHVPADRRGSEPALLRAEVVSRHQRSTLQQMSNVSNNRHSTRRLAEDTTNAQSQESRLPVSQEAVQVSELVQAGACDAGKETPVNELQEVGAAAAGASQENMEAFLQSKDVTCGICMDKVYEKTHPRNQMFGILPNCSHAFCLQCIRTWRKTKDFGPDVVKTCPQCRMRSAFYVPNKYWVEGQAKETLIAAFKEKFSKRTCSYYARYRCCPFKTECLYRHDKSARRASFPYYTEDDDDDEDIDSVDLLNFFIAMTLLAGDDDDEDDFDFPFSLNEEYGF